jgi:pantothenate synthetase
MEQLQIPVFTEKHDVREYARAQRMAGKRIGMVGTMGAVHAGD